MKIDEIYNENIHTTFLLRKCFKTIFFNSLYGDIEIRKDNETRKMWEHSGVNK